jgi:D-sedoheptulose 7-phosphate isomerase
MTNLLKWIQEYKDSYSKLILSLPEHEIFEILNKIKISPDKKQKIFVIGNGGSAANASHFVTDLGKGASDAAGKRFNCLSLNDNVSWITAIGNDYSYDDIFKKQLINYAQSGDILIALSVSGSSPNLIEAIKWANENGLFTVTLVGANEGEIAQIADFSLVVNSTHYGFVEDAHMTICHMLCYAIIENNLVN